MATSECQGSIFVLALCDVCDEISLSELRPLIGGKQRALAFKHTTPGYVRFERPPVLESLEPVTLETGERFDAAMQYYNYGVVSVLLRRSYSGQLAGLAATRRAMDLRTFFDELTIRLVLQCLANVGAALRKPYEKWLMRSVTVLAARLQNTLFHWQRHAIQDRVYSYDAASHEVFCR